MPIDYDLLAAKMSALQGPYRDWLARDVLHYLVDAQNRYHQPDFDHERLFFHIHKLKGTGATYGFDAISLQAAPLHDALSDGTADLQTIHKMLGGLITACEHAIHS